MLKPKTKTILQDEFRMVPNLEALYVLPTASRRADLYAYAPGVADSDLAFEAFRDAADRLMSEAPSSPYLTWYGLTQAPIEGAEKVSL